MKKLILIVIILVTLFSVGSVKAQSQCDPTGSSISIVLDAMKSQGLTLDTNQADPNLFAGVYNKQPLRVQVVGLLSFSFGDSTASVVVDGCPVVVTAKSWPTGLGPFTIDGMVSGTKIVTYNGSPIDLPFIDKATVTDAVDSTTGFLS